MVELIFKDLGVVIYIFKDTNLYILVASYIHTMVDIKEKIKDLLDDKTFNYINSIGYFTAPASSKHHLNTPGGLAIHSYNVYMVLKDLVSKYKLSITDKETINISLLHDVCKCDMYEEDVYKTGKNKGELKYTSNDTLPIGHGDKSVIMLLKNGIELTDKEIMCIRYHMGSFTYESSLQWTKATNMITKAGYNIEVMALHISDMIAARILEDGNIFYELYD